MYQESEYDREVRDVVVKSSLTGVAATALAVVAFSPVGFGGVVGASFASGLGLGHDARAHDERYVQLPPFVSPLSQTELSDIRGELARTAASLEITRAATDDKVAYLRTVASQQELNASLAPARHAAALNVTTTALAAPANFVATGVLPAHHDRDMELAALLLAHERI
jgi:hypothetical protein